MVLNSCFMTIYLRYSVWGDINNPLTNVLTTAKLDATGQRLVDSLSGYKFSIKHRSGKKNADADGLSRHKHPQEE